MSDFLFVLKCLAVTVVLILLMQIKIGDATVEEHSVGWIHESRVVAMLRSVSAGGVKAVQHGTRYIGTFFDTHSSRVFGRETPGSRFSGFSFQRSETVERESDRRRRDAGAAKAREAQETNDSADLEDGDHS